MILLANSNSQLRVVRNLAGQFHQGINMREDVVQRCAAGMQYLHPLIQHLAHIGLHAQQVIGDYSEIGQQRIFTFQRRDQMIIQSLIA